VFNLKLSVIAAGAAFVLSFFIGLISGTGFPYMLLRALISGALFFCLSAFAYWAISQFVPELLDFSQNDQALSGGVPQPGSMVDISVEPGEDETDVLPPLDQQYAEAGPAAEARTESPPETERFQEAAPLEQKSADTGPNQAAALDLGAEDGYTNEGVSVDSGPVASGAKTGEDAVLPDAVDAAEAVDTLPDLELLSTVFTPQEEEEPGEEAFIPADIGGISGTGPPPAKNTSAGQGDFNVKEMAQAIQTILRKDEKG
jgi:hypothetical protein